ncbi:hypothetical protein AB1207_23555 [Kineococcus endophyticus]|uniref:DUF937 domain-containing protein n=1 Tax=Kineococcus endophyticus TaxID=1181883 RepID=A0ABV3PE03_9ACTN
MKMTKRIVGAGVAGIVAVSGLGVAVLASPATAATSTTDSSGATGALASRLQRVKDALAGLVSDGTITQDQADKVADTLSTSDALRGGPGGHGGRLIDLDTAATTLGLSQDDLRTALQADGATLASVASSQGVDEQKLVDALVAAATSRLAQQVSDGNLTQAQADARTADLPAQVKQAVESTFPGRGGRGGPGGDHDGDGPGSSSSSGSGSSSSTPSASPSSSTAA